MRTSNDVWKLADGTLVSFNQDTQPPEGASVYDGYDYKEQCWIHRGARDTRPIEVLKRAMQMGKCECAICNALPR